MSNILKKMLVPSVLSMGAFIVSSSFIPSFALAAGPAAVDLLSIPTNNFVVVSKTGITNTGGHTSGIVGNIGASPITAAAMNGIFCSEIMGTIYGVNAAYVGSGDQTCFAGNPPLANKTLIDNAVADMATAYTDAAGRTLPTATELGAGNIGGLTIAPGLYKWSTNVTIPADVTLSGGAGDVWIFQMTGNLTLSSAKNVILSGGAVASNVFWQVGGPTGATLGTYSTFNGNILSNKQIIVQTGAVLNGRALAKTQVTLDANSVFLSDITPPTPTGPVFNDTDGDHNLDTGETTFTTIQAAVDGSTSGDIIQVTAGTYPELVIVNKPLTINGAQVGIDANDCTVSAGSGSTVGSPSGAFVVQANDVTIDGFTIQGVSSDWNAGVHIGSSISGATVQNNTIQENVMGIWLNGTNHLVQQNCISNNNVAGSGSGNGIDSEEGLSITQILNNTFTGAHLNTSIQLASENSSNITISGNILRSDNEILLVNTIGATISNNTITDSLAHGIQIGGGNSDIEITGNRVHGSALGWSAVRINGVPMNNGIVIRNNSLTGNDYGVNVTAASGSGVLINFNDLTGNTDEALYYGIGGPVLNAENNWWGCSTGPNTGICGVIGTDGSVVDSDPWLSTLNLTGNNPVTGRILNSDGVYVGGDTGLKVKYTSSGANAAATQTSLIGADQKALYAINANGPAAGTTTILGIVLFADEDSTLRNTLTIVKTGGGGGGGSLPPSNTNGNSNLNTNSGTGNENGNQNSNTNGSGTPLPADRFDDTDGHWAEDVIQRLKEECNIQGYRTPAGYYLNLFRPDAQVTRAELLAMLIQCSEGNLPLVDVAPFSDVPTSHWAAQYIARGKARGIVEGYMFKDGVPFKPDQFATRSEALKMIELNFVSWDEVSKAPLTTLCNDLNQSNWAAVYWNYGVTNGIIKGYTDNNGNPLNLCKPDNLVTRAEAATMIMRMKDFVSSMLDGQ